MFVNEMISTKLKARAESVSSSPMFPTSAGLLARGMLCASLTVLLAACGGGSGSGTAQTDSAASSTQLATTTVVSTSTNLALNKPATASSAESTSLTAARAVDGSLSSRWSSLYSDNQWITVDLGVAQTINHVVLNWEAAYGKSYQIQTSSDGITWNTVYSTTAGVGGTEDIRFNAVSVRYVKMNGVQRATVWGYSLYEMMVYNDAPQNLAANKPASASSVESSSMSASAAVDANLSTRWGSLYSDAQWIMVDLGVATPVSHVVLNWETAYGKSYQIQTSTDGTNWATVYSTTAGVGGKEDIKFNAVSARYVKMNGIQRATAWGYSLYEFMVYNDGSTTTTVALAPSPTPSPTLTPSATTRDPLKQPFASNSIWNMPIGSGAVYVPANLGASKNSSGMPQVDDEHIVLKSTAPLTAINASSVGWSGGNRCNATGGLLVSVPIPTNYVVANNIDNGSSAFLATDGRTIIQSQPLARCSAGGPATSLLTFPSVDLYGAGITGSHGGSRLSAIGGSIRIGELRPGQQGPHHALKVNVDSPKVLYPCKTFSDCFRWPAVTADGPAVGYYGSTTSSPNSAMKMGSLLAIPASVNIAGLGLETEPGKELAWTLQNYGAYIVDTTGGSGLALNSEDGPDGSLHDQFQSDYGTPFQIWTPGSTAWSRDIQRLMVALYVVDNNSATSIGGGGTPRQPLAPAI